MGIRKIAQIRCCATVVGSAIGDALGAPYEFGPALSDDVIPQYGPGKGGQEPGEWTDDTAMAVPILEGIYVGFSPGSDNGLQFTADRWFKWLQDDGRGAGNQISAVLNRAKEETRLEQERTGEKPDGLVRIGPLFKAAEDHHRETGKSAGNGSLMRIAPLAIAYLNDGKEEDLVQAATKLAQLTHWEEDNVDACIIWSFAIRHAIRRGELDVGDQVQWIPEVRQERWMSLIEEASARGVHPRDFATDERGRNNSWVVLAFQAALAAVHGAENFTDAVQRAARGGGDTAAVGTITGALAGPYFGWDDIPEELITPLHGWPGMTGMTLAQMVCEIIDT